MDISSENNENNIDPLAAKDLFNNPHDALPDFLKPEKIRDKNGNRPDSPEYDCNTLYIPNDSIFTKIYNIYFIIKIISYFFIYIIKNNCSHSHK